jgi:hypothetical protein
MNRRNLRFVAALGLLSAVLAGACARRSPAPTAAEWAHRGNAICSQINSARQGEAAAAHMPTGDEAPSVQQMQAFYAAFAPRFRGYIDDIGALDRPDSLRSTIGRLVDTGHAFVDHMNAAAHDDATAQADIRLGGETDDTVRLVALGKELGLTTCVG